MDEYLNILKQIGLEKMYNDARCFNRITDGNSPPKISQVTNVTDDNDIDYIALFIEDAECGGFFISLDRKSLVEQMEKEDKRKI